MKGKIKKKTKTVLTFDDNARKEYLSGFQKRKRDRKEKAQKEIERKLKNQIKQERDKRRKAAQTKVNEILEGISLPGDDEQTIEGITETHDYGTHEVLVKTDIEFASSGLFITNSTEDDENTVKASTSNTKTLHSKNDKWNKDSFKSKKRK